VRLFQTRLRNFTKGTIRLEPQRLGVTTNPAYLNPADLAAHSLAPGDLAQLRSRHGAIEVVVEADPGLRPGVLAIAHGFGLGPDEKPDPRRHGANVNRLIGLDEDYDRFSGMPRMGAIPVALTPLV
jgi:anaerobic selenocysteine-containing dehydrogenase